MKRVFILFLLLISFFIMSGFSFVTDKVDRSLPLKYPEKARNANSVIVYLEKGYAYHNSTLCKTEEELLKVRKEEQTRMTEYEALVRGFFECPDCTEDAEKVDVTFIDDIYDMVLSIYNALFE